MLMHSPVRALYTCPLCPLNVGSTSAHLTNFVNSNSLYKYFSSCLYSNTVTVLHFLNGYRENLDFHKVKFNLQNTEWCFGLEASNGNGRSLSYRDHSLYSLHSLHSFIHFVLKKKNLIVLRVLMFHGDNEKCTFVYSTFLIMTENDDK